MALQRFCNYEEGDDRPINPLTGKPADYYWLHNGERQPRWRREKKLSRTVDELLKRPEMVWLSVSDTAELLGFCGQTVRDWIKTGRLPASRPHHHFRINGADLIAFTKRQRGVAPPVNLVAAL